MSERLDSDVVRLENQGDAVCPYRLKSVWRYADGDLKVNTLKIISKVNANNNSFQALVYDNSLKAVCLEDPCSVAHCGHQADCVVNEEEGKGVAAVCQCKDGFYGNPYER